MPDVSYGGPRASESKEEWLDRIERERLERDKQTLVDYDANRYRNALKEVEFYRTALAAVIAEHPERAVSYSDVAKMNYATNRAIIVMHYDPVNRRTILRLQFEGKLIEPGSAAVGV